jgi:hypothetical protein
MLLVVYEDEFQAVAEPFRDTRTGLRQMQP